MKQKKDKVTAPLDMATLGKCLLCTDHENCPNHEIALGFYGSARVRAICVIVEQTAKLKN